MTGGNCPDNEQCVKTEKKTRRVHLRGGPGEIIAITSQYFSNLLICSGPGPPLGIRVLRVIYGINKIFQEILQSETNAKLDLMVALNEILLIDNIQ